MVTLTLATLISNGVNLAGNGVHGPQVSHALGKATNPSPKNGNLLLGHYTVHDSKGSKFIGSLVRAALPK